MSFTGVIPAVVTPFDAEDEVDVDALAANVTVLLEAGIAGLVVTGTMGEAGSLTEPERKLVIETVVRAAGGRVPVISGVSAAATRVAQQYAELARDGGCAGVMCLPPLNYRGELRETIAFYTAVADASELPVMVYNNPEAAGVDLTPEAVTAIAAAVPAVTSVKECSADARRIARLRELGSLNVLVGGDDWALEGYAAGAVGWVSGIANVVPVDCVALEAHILAGRLHDARAVYQRLLPLARLDMTPWLVQYFKAAMDAMGLAGGPARSPRLPLSDERRDDLDAALRALRLSTVV